MTESHEVHRLELWYSALLWIFCIWIKNIERVCLFPHTLKAALVSVGAALCQDVCSPSLPPPVLAGCDVSSQFVPVISPSRTPALASDPRIPQKRIQQWVLLLFKPAQWEWMKSRALRVRAAGSSLTPGRALLRFYPRYLDGKWHHNQISKKSKFVRSDLRRRKPLWHPNSSNSRYRSATDYSSFSVFLRLAAETKQKKKTRAIRWPWGLTVLQLKKHIQKDKTNAN